MQPLTKQAKNVVAQPKTVEALPEVVEALPETSAAQLKAAEAQPETTAEQLEACRFVGQTLAPFFLHDPFLEAAAIDALLETLAITDAKTLAADWPFIDKDEALSAQKALTTGAREALSNRTALADDYRQLFVGPGPKLAPPWGSVYTDKDCVIFGASTLRLKSWLREHGISISFGVSDEPEDSMGALLALLAWICDQRPELVTEFLTLHVLPWAPHFLQLMEANAQHPFYQGLAALTRLSLIGMQRCLDLQVKIPRFYK